MKKESPRALLFCWKLTFCQNFHNFKENVSKSLDNLTKVWYIINW